MQEQNATLFNPKTINRLCSSVTISSTQKRAALQWLGYLDNDQLRDERSNYLRFADLILDKILGYPIGTTLYETDNVEFQFSDHGGKNVVCFEAKGTNTKDLFAIQYREKKEHETPIKQTWDYMGKNALKYGVCTNYRDFILIDRNRGYSDCHVFDFTTIRNNDQKLKEFIAIFAKASLVDSDFVEKLYVASMEEQRVFTEEFYKLYHETRLMLIKEFEVNAKADKDTCIKYAQLFLNRLIFIFFAEGTGKIPGKLFERNFASILNPLLLSDHSKVASEVISSLFDSLDKGSKKPIEIFGFNGGLFRDKIPTDFNFKDLRDSSFFKELLLGSKLQRDVKLNERMQTLVGQFGTSLNQIIKNILLMASFDFRTELRVDILGHIFEQSLSDLEQLKSNEVSRRRKQGIFYTPEYVTDYICRNAILRHLSRTKRASTVADLISEYRDSIGDLEERFREIKILDPACGSGAFLLKCVDVLLEVNKEIQAYKEFLGKYTIDDKGRTSDHAKQFTLARWNEETEARKIIENNIFGVDLNEESVEITRLSLFLKIASGERKLIDLSRNIKQGNSLIDDKSIDSRAFDWNAEFPEIMMGKKFSVIIGNPPYVRVQFLDYKVIDWLKKKKETAFKRIDISTLFFELAKSLLAPGGIVCYITSNQFLTTEYGRKTRKFLLKQFRIISIIDFGDLPVFEDALTYVGIFTLENDSAQNFAYLRVRTIDEGRNINLRNAISVEVASLDDSAWVLGRKSDLSLIDKISKHPRIQDLGNACAGVITGLDDVLLLNEERTKELGIENEVILPIIRGDDPERYGPVTPSRCVIYPYTIINGKTVIMSEEYLASRYPIAYQYLLTHKKPLESRRDSRKTFAEKGQWYGLVRFGRFDLFNQPKIVTPGEVKTHKFALDTSHAGFSCARVFAIVVEDKSYDLKYVLAILNSKVARFYLQNTSPKKQGGYFTYSSKFLNEAPIPHATESQQKPFIEKADKLMELNRLIDEKRKTFVRRMQQNLNHLVMSKKLEGFHLLEFEEFVVELRKQRINLSLQEQDEWQDYFRTHKAEVLSLIAQRDKLDEELDEMAYAL